jgi:hypothetical protein
MVKVAQLFGHVWMPSFAHNGLRMPEALEVSLHHPNYIDFINCMTSPAELTLPLGPMFPQRCPKFQV